MKRTRMTASADYTHIIRVRIKKTDRDVFVATSQAMNGLLVVSQNLEKLLDELVPQAISDLFEASGPDIIVSRARDESHDERDTPFVVMPLAIAKSALEAHRA